MGWKAKEAHATAQKIGEPGAFGASWRETLIPVP